MTCGVFPLSAGEELHHYPANPIHEGDAIYVSSEGISRFDTTTLALDWRALKSKSTYEPVVAGATLLAGSAAGLYALDADSGSLRWHLASEEPIFSPMIAGPVAYAGSRDGWLRAVEVGTGELRWQRQFDGWIYPPAIAGGRLIAGGSAGVLHGLDPDTGHTIWHRELTQELVYRPVAAPGGGVLVTTFAGDVMLLDGASGSIRWRRRDPVASTAPLVQGKRVFTTSFDGSLNARRLSDGRVLWQAALDQPVSLAPRIVADELLLSSNGASVLAYDAGSGRPLWRNELRHELAVGPIRVGQRVFVYLVDGRVISWPLDIPGLDASLNTVLRGAEGVSEVR